MPPTPPPALFIASLGNPGAAYAHTRHSAGHIVLHALARQLSAPPFTPLAKAPSTTVTVTLPAPPGRNSKRPRSPRAPAWQLADRAATADADAPAPSAPWTLWQSPSYMNESGPLLVRAFRAWAAVQARPGLLVVLHDALDLAAGEVAVRADAQALSTKGHNGIRSVANTFRGAGAGVKWIKVSVGIGRPGGEKGTRDAKEVSDWVLGKMRDDELQVLQDRGTQGVWTELCKIGRAP